MPGVPVRGMRPMPWRHVHLPMPDAGDPMAGTSGTPTDPTAPAGRTAAATATGPTEYVHTAPRWHADPSTATGSDQTLDQRPTRPTAGTSGTRTEDRRPPIVHRPAGAEPPDDPQRRGTMLSGDTRRARPHVRRVLRAGLRPPSTPVKGDAMTDVTETRTRLHVTSITLADARKFVGEHHRHNLPPKMARFAVAVADPDGLIVGVAIASNPVARMLNGTNTLEVVRSCTDGTPNANSMLYGAMARAAKALGFARLITYTLESEPGTSLVAAGWVRDGETPARDGWGCPSRPRYQHDLFGDDRRPPGKKVRWAKQLTR